MDEQINSLVQTINELEAENKKLKERITQHEALLPKYNLKELDEIVDKFNNKEASLHDFVASVWNKAYTIGYTQNQQP
jgi:regulator of replication initiation timing